ncbi:hypothetical protein ACUH93_07115 [Dermabacteraceae bacterium P7006]
MSTPSTDDWAGWAAYWTKQADKHAVQAERCAARAEYWADLVAEADEFIQQVEQQAANAKEAGK